MTEPLCHADHWNAGVQYWCDMRQGHAGPHVDTWEGAEW